jgi:HAD superfamily hydrolase (TIGR01509 family)
MIKAVLFDMDGVLYDSMRGHVAAWQETIAASGLQSDPEDFYLLEGRTGHSTIDILFTRNLGRKATQEEKESIYTRKAQRFMELDAYSKPMPGAREVLEIVKQLGLKRILVTGSGQKSLFENLDLHFPGFFEKELMVTAYDVQYGKPHPEPYCMGLQKANLTSGEAIVVENAPLGVESAVAAGIYTIAVNTGPLPDEVLWDAGAKALFPSMEVLAKNSTIESIINQLNNS